MQPVDQVKAHTYSFHCCPQTFPAKPSPCSGVPDGCPPTPVLAAPSSTPPSQLGQDTLPNNDLKRHKRFLIRQKYNQQVFFSKWSSAASSWDKGLPPAAPIAVAQVRSHKRSDADRYAERGGNTDVMIAAKLESV
ncbi:unnamed protein product [Pleuronectes platessa]|uniref:Uncharacterized protein n=1 Tax=Pleuronectes platessa TaxID=8262 RepID=A0A9N7TKY9_PLEPL|nr:unnamed protein product [Pleuronectes platessa]